MHPSVENHPEWQALQARKADLERARRATTRAASDHAAERARLDREYEEAMERALGDATAVPPPKPVYPQAPDVAEMAHRVIAKKETLKAEERAWLADNADALLTILYRSEDRLAREIAPVVEALEGPARELAEIAETAAALRAARGDRVAAVERVDVPAVVDAVRRGHRWVPRPARATPGEPGGRTSADKVEAEAVARQERMMSPGVQRRGRPWMRR